MYIDKIDKQNRTSASSQIRDMAVVLNEIAPTLEVLQNLLIQHRRSISAPTIDSYMESLQQTVARTIKMTRAIAKSSQQVCSISEQASRHMAAVDKHYGSVLRDKSGLASKLPVRVVSDITVDKRPYLASPAVLHKF